MDHKIQHDTWRLPRFGKRRPLLPTWGQPQHPARQLLDSLASFVPEGTTLFRPVCMVRDDGPWWRLTARYFWCILRSCFSIGVCIWLGFGHGVLDLSGIRWCQLHVTNTFEWRDQEHWRVQTWRLNFQKQMLPCLTRYRVSLFCFWCLSFPRRNSRTELLGCAGLFPKGGGFVPFFHTKRCQSQVVEVSLSEHSALFRLGW